MTPPLLKYDFLFSPAYTMAKYGMSMCVLGMAGELEPQGVAVNALWPRTGMHCGAMVCPCVCWGWQGSWNHREWQSMHCGLVQVCTVGPLVCLVTLSKPYTANQRCCVHTSFTNFVHSVSCCYGCYGNVGRRRGGEEVSQARDHG